MAAWTDGVITQKGLQMLAASLEGKPLSITKVKGGSSVYPAASLMVQNDVTAPKINFGIIGFNDIDSGKLVKIRVNNAGLKTSYTLRQIGIFASDGESEYLFAIVQDETGEYVPAESETANFIIEFEFVIPVSNTENISVTVAQNEYASAENFNEHINAVNPHGLTISDIGAASIGHTHNNVTSNTDGFMSYADKAKLDGITYIYSCAGANDNLAIRNILNDFFDNGTAMTMKLMVTGKMGLQPSPSNNRYIALNSANERGATAHIDFSNCEIDITATTARTMMYCSGNVRTAINGLDDLIYGYSVYLTDTASAVFTNCRLHNHTSSSYANIYLTGESECLFMNCNIHSANNRGVMFSEGSSGTFMNCRITSNGSLYHGVYISGSSTVNISKCIIVRSGSSSSGAGVYAHNDFSGILRISDSKIVDSNQGLRVTGANTDINISLTGCDIKGGAQDIYQLTASDTIGWHITGCRFSKAGVIVDGATLITNKLSDKIYMPQYANKFNQTIE